MGKKYKHRPKVNLETYEPKYPHPVEERPSKLKHLKNMYMLDNAYDPHAGKYVKQVDLMKISKLGRKMWPLIWQFYRDRKRTPVETLYKKYNGWVMKFIYFDDPVIYEVNLQIEGQNYPGSRRAIDNIDPITLENEYPEYYDISNDNSVVEVDCLPELE